MKLLRVRTKGELDDQVKEITRQLFIFLTQHKDFNPEKLLLFKEGPDQYLIRYKGQICLTTYKSLAHFIHVYKEFGFWDLPITKEHPSLIDWVENAESYKGLRGSVRLKIKNPLSLTGADVYSLWSDITHIPQEVDRYEYRWSIEVKGHGDIGVLKNTVSAFESKVFGNLWQWLDEHDAWYIIPRGCSPFDNPWRSSCHIEYHILGNKEKRLANWEEAYLYSLAKYKEIQYNAKRYSLHKEKISLEWTNNFDFSGTSWVDADQAFEYYGHYPDQYQEEDAIFIYPGTRNQSGNSGSTNNKNNSIQQVLIKGIITGALTWVFR